MTVLAFLLASVLIPQPVEFVELPGVCCRTSVTDRCDASVPSEGYRLEVTTNGIVVVSSTAAGAFYARQTLAQLAETRDGRTVYPCCRIDDRPAYPWRGVLIDEGRHFMGKETIDQNTRLTAGGDEKLMPRFAATMGMAPILAAKKCLLLACFAEQIAPLKAILAKGEPTPFLPASYLWRHPDYRLVYTTDKIAL